MECGNKLVDGAKFCPECGTKQPEPKKVDNNSGGSVNIGDKNVISGDIIGHKEEINAQNVVINKHEDDTKRAVKCAISGKTILALDSITCPDCGKVISKECYIVESRRCSDCEEQAKQMYAKIFASVERPISMKSRDQLDDAVRELRISFKDKQRIENLGSAETRDSSMNKIMQMEFDRAQKSLYENDFKTAYKILDNLHDRTENDEVHFWYYMAHALLKEEESVMEYEGREYDNRWQMFWVFIAYIKVQDYMAGTDAIEKYKANFGFEGSIAEVAYYLCCANATKDNSYIKYADLTLNSMPESNFAPLKLLREAIQYALIHEGCVFAKKYLPNPKITVFLQNIFLFKEALIDEINDNNYETKLHCIRAYEDNELLSHRMWEVKYNSAPLKLLNYVKDEMFGSIKANGEIITPAIYDEVFMSTFDYQCVRSGNKWGVINSSGEEIIPCKYDFLYAMTENILTVGNKGKHGFMTLNEEMITPMKYDFTSEFEGGLAGVEYNKLWGLVDLNGKEVVPHIYDVINIFFDNRRYVCRKNLWGITDSTGKEIIPCIYDSLDDFASEIARVKRKEFFGYINRRGDEFIPCEYAELGEYKNGFIKFKNKKGKCSFFRKNGKQINTNEYFDDARDFSEDFAAVCTNEKWGYIDSNGKKVIPCQYDYAGQFEEGKAIVLDDKEVFHIINRFGQKIKSFLACMVYDYVNDFAVCEYEDDKFTMLTNAGFRINNIAYEKVWPFNSRGIAIVKENGKFGCINKKGEVTIPNVCDEIFDTNEGLYVVQYKGKWGCITEMNKIVVPIIFDVVNKDYDGIYKVMKDDLVGYYNSLGREIRELIKPMIAATDEYVEEEEELDEYEYDDDDDDYVDNEDYPYGDDDDDEEDDDDDDDDDEEEEPKKKRGFFGFFK